LLFSPYRKLHNTSLQGFQVRCKGPLLIIREVHGNAVHDRRLAQIFLNHGKLTHPVLGMLTG